MAQLFPSEEWVKAYQAAIRSSDYSETGKTWTRGVVALVCKAEPAVGLKDDVGIWLDLHEGQCRDARLVPAEEARQAPFVVTGEYARWKQVIQGKLDPIKGMMQGKLRLKGDLPTIVRYVKASKTLVASAAKVETSFLDE
jgi:putative sterol carrier protein